MLAIPRLINPNNIEEPNDDPLISTAINEILEEKYKDEEDINAGELAESIMSFIQLDYYLIGPTRLTTLYSSKYNKKIMIMSDHHVRESVCEIETDNIILHIDFVIKLLNIHKNKFFYLFSEDADINCKKFQRICYLDDFRYYFHNNRKKLKNLKYIPVDIRLDEKMVMSSLYKAVRIVFEFKDNLIVLRDAIKEEIEEKVENDIKMIGFLETFILMKERLIDEANCDLSNLDSFGYSSLEDSGVINSLKLIENGEVVEKFLEHFSNRMFDINNQIVLNVKTIETFKNDDKANQGLINIIVLINYFFGLFMDMYLLSQLFKPHTIPNENNIIYAGSYHTSNYLDFLVNYLHFEVIDDIISNETGKNFQCLDIHDLIDIFE